MIVASGAALSRSLLEAGGSGDLLDEHGAEAAALGHLGLEQLAVLRDLDLHRHLRAYVDVFDG